MQEALNDYRVTFAIDVPRFRAERAEGRRIQVPLLALWGASGNLAGMPDIEAWREVADDVRGFELAGCGHYLPEEQPETVAAHLLEFARVCFASEPTRD